MISRLLQALWLPAIVTLLCHSVAFSKELMLGVFEIDASPPIGSPLAYDPTKEVETPLTCKGIVLLSHEAPIVIATLDWIGIGNASHVAFRQQLATACGTSIDRVAVHVIHQHDAPWCDDSMEAILNQANVSGHPFDSAFSHRIMGAAAQAAKAAVEKARPVTHMGMSKAKVEQVASNRRILGPDGKVLHVRWTATADPEVRAYPEGTIDPMLQMVTFWQDQQPLVALTYYATHPQSYYRTGKANSDFPGLARDARQAATGVPHLHFNGAGGNVGAGKYNDGNPANRRILAERLQSAMKMAWDTKQPVPITAEDVAWKSTPVSLPVTRHYDQKLLADSFANPEASIQQKLVAAGKLAWVHRMQAGEKIEIGCLHLGKGMILHMPGELFVEYQIRAQAMAPDRAVAMAAYGDYGPAYIGTTISYDQGGYETGPDASFVAPEVEPVLLNAMKRVMMIGSNPQDGPLP